MSSYEQEVSETDKQKALEAKLRGNAFFKKKQFAAAINAYSEVNKGLPVVLLLLFDCGW
jgi:hypothetical protein